MNPIGTLEQGQMSKHSNLGPGGQDPNLVNYYVFTMLFTMFFTMFFTMLQRTGPGSRTNEKHSINEEEIIQ